MAGFALAGALLVCGGAWLASNLVGRDVPAPLWTKDALPDPPPEAANGWSLVTTDAAEIDLALPDELITLAKSSASSPEELWAAVDERGEALSDWVRSHEARSGLARFELARARPSFVDVCEPGVRGGERCQGFTWFELHRLVELLALELMRVGQYDTAAACVRDLIRMDLDHLASARTLISAAIALANLEGALDKADKIAAHPQLLTARAGQPPSAAYLELAGVVERVDVERLDLGLAVIGEYQFMIEAVDAVATGEDLEIPRDRAMPRWLFDHGRTMTVINERFAARRTAAKAGDVAGALGVGEPASAEGFGWWLHDATGKLLLDALTVNASSVAASIAEQQANITRLRASVLARLTSSAPGGR